MIDQLLEIAGQSEPEKMAFLDESIEKVAKEFREEFVEEQKQILDECTSLLSEYEKTAGFIDGLKSVASKIPGKVMGIGKSVANNSIVQGAAVTAGGAIGTALLNDLYNAAKSGISKSRNYQKMIAVNPGLQNYDAEHVKAYFNTLHEKGGPEMSGDPFIAGSFVENQLQLGGTSLLDQVSKIVSTRKALGDSTRVFKDSMKFNMERGKSTAPPKRDMHVDSYL